MAHFLIELIDEILTLE